MFRKEIIEIFEKYKEGKILSLLENYLHQHDKRFITELISLSIRPKRLIGQNGIFFLQNVLFRSKTLIDGWISSVNEQNVLCAALITRAHYESTGSVVLYLKKLRSFYANNISLDEFEKSFNELSLGIKMKTSLSDPPKPINVMTLIDTVDKILQSNDFRESYDFLSEFCHPNHHGIMMGSNVFDGSTVKFTNNYEISQKDFSILGYMQLSVILFIDLYDKAKTLLKENEELPIMYT